MKQETPLYENIYIGAFIYALGIISGQRGETHSNAFSLIQQTPNDRLVGDLFARWEGSNFIIEFKRTEADIKRELKKPIKKSLLNKLQTCEQLANTARLCHFICYADSPYNEAELIFIPYTEINSPSLYRDPFDLACFINRILERKLGISLKGLERYIGSLKRLAGTSSASFGGLIINIDKNGIPNLVRFDNLLSLERSLEKANELERDRGRELER